MNPGIGLTVCAALLAVAAGACSKQPPAGRTAPTPSAGAEVGRAQESAKAPAAGPALCEHQVPAELCTRCNPDLIEVFKDQGDWCAGHGLPESHCRACNPGLTFGSAAPAKDWCAEHGVPESKCTKCHPNLVAQFVGARDYCREHGFPESVCPQCHPELVKAAGAQLPPFPKPGTVVRLASEHTAGEAGLRTVRAERRQIARSLEVVGQLEFNQNRLAELSARGEALVLEVRADVGDEVKRGQPLLTLVSAGVGASQSQLTAAEARLKAARAAAQREEGLVEKGISPRKSLELAQTEVAAAEAEYHAAKAALGAAGAGVEGSSGHHTLVAPISGTVVARDAVVGRTTTPEAVLVRIADLSSVWAQLDVPEEGAGSVRVGQRVLLTLEGRAGEHEGTIARVGASVDPATRTVSARVELPNPDRTLKAGTFVRGRIELAAAQPGLMIPSESVQRAEAATLVFVKREATAFVPVAVKLGAARGEWVEVLEGLSPGDEVVTTGAFLLKTEILKESIGAGCCDEVGGK